MAPRKAQPDLKNQDTQTGAGDQPDPTPARDEKSGQETASAETDRARTQNPDKNAPTAFTNKPEPAATGTLAKPNQTLLTDEQGVENVRSGPHLIVNSPYGSQPRGLDTETGKILPPTPGTDAVAAGVPDGEPVKGQNPGGKDSLEGGASQGG